jgi:hypothetical protein
MSKEALVDGLAMLAMIIVIATCWYVIGYQRGQDARDRAWCEGVAAGLHIERLDLAVCK